MVQTLLPWHVDLWAGLQERRRLERLPHALLISGRAGLGKQRLALQLAASLLCHSPGADGMHCGQCRSCTLLAAGTHPDLESVGLEDDRKSIVVDQIRRLGDFLALKSHFFRGKVVMISPADRMQTSAANSLLKNLEEPPSDVYFILVTDRPTALLPTVRSRCQTLAVTAPVLEVGARWLKSELGAQGLQGDPEFLLSLTQGAPLATLELAGSGKVTARGDILGALIALARQPADIGAAAATWGEHGMADTLYWLRSATQDLIRLKSGATAVDIQNRDLVPQLGAMAEAIESTALFAALDHLGDAARWAQGSINTQLLFEELAISWERMLSRKAANREVQTT